MADDHQRAVALIRRGLACGRRNQMEGGVLCLIEGLGRIDAASHPRLTLCALHNLALFLAGLGLTVLSRAVVVRAKPLYRKVGDPEMSARLLWLEGSVARQTRRYELAARKLEQARIAFSRFDFRQALQIREELMSVLFQLKRTRAA